jgi:hypothetical protein
MESFSSALPHEQRCNQNKRRQQHDHADHRKTRERGQHGLELPERGAALIRVYGNRCDPQRDNKNWGLIYLTPTDQLHAGLPGSIYA